jgi:hypothetical protein
METPQDSPQAQPEAEKEKKKLKRPHTYRVSWPVVFIIILIGVGAYGFWSYSQTSKLQSKLSAKTEELNNKQQELNDIKADRDKAADSLLQASAEQGFLVIKGTQVKFRPGTSLDDLSYVVYENDIRLSSSSLMTSAYGPYFKNPDKQNEYGICAPADAPLGIISSYKAGEQYNGAAIEANNLAVKAGDNYYVLETPNAPCSQDKATQDLQTKQTAALKEAIKTLVSTK